MKTYTESLDYQGLVTALENAKNVYQEAKNQKKEVRAFFKSAKKEAKSKAPIHAAHLKYRQAKLEQKFEALTARAAELDIKEFVLAFNQQEKVAAKAAKVAKKEESTPKVKTSKKADNAADAMEKAAPKAGKANQTTKTTTKATAKIAAKAAKKVVEVKVKVEKSAKSTQKAAKKAAAVTQTVVEKPAVAEGKAVKVTKKVVEKPVVAREKAVKVTKTVVEKPVVKTEVAVTQSSIDDLTVIEGIGPKIAQILNEKGVKNFKSLIATPVETIKMWLTENKLQFIDPTTWAEQAQLVDAGKMSAFEALKQALKGGKRS